jgi:hypothetical protein
MPSCPNWRYSLSYADRRASRRGVGAVGFRRLKARKAVATKQRAVPSPRAIECEEIIAVFTCKKRLYRTPE